MSLNFTLLDISRPEVARLVAAMVQARDAVERRSWSHPQEPREAPMSTRPELLITLVHGTWGRGFLPWLRVSAGLFWFENGSNFRAKLSNSLKERAIAHSIRPFLWSGANSIFHRDNAAYELAKHLAAERTANPHAMQMVIAHSHGGNVAFRAMHYLKSFKSSHCLNLQQCHPLIATMATPFMEIHQMRSSGHAGFLLLIGFIFFLTAFLDVTSSFDYSIFRFSFDAGQIYPVVTLAVVLVTSLSIASVCLLYDRYSYDKVLKLQRASALDFRAASATLIIRAIDVVAPERPDTVTSFRELR
jgi:hypothetical protein